MNKIAQTLVAASAAIVLLAGCSAGSVLESHVTATVTPEVEFLSVMHKTTDASDQQLVAAARGLCDDFEAGTVSGPIDPEFAYWGAYAYCPVYNGL